MIADQEFVKLTSELYIADYKQNKQDNQHNEQATIRLEMHKQKLDLANQELDKLHNDPIFKLHQDQLKQLESQLGRFKNEQDLKRLNKIKDKAIETEIDYTLANLLLKDNLITLQQQAKDNKQSLFNELDSNHKIKSYINNLNQAKSDFKAATKLTRAIITKEMELTQTEIRLNKLNPENQAHQNKIVKLNKQKDTLTKLLATHKDDLQAELKTTNIHKFADTTLAYMTLKEAINPNILAKYGIGITNKHQPLFEKKVLTGIEYEQDRQNKAKNLEERQKTIKTNGADYGNMEQEIDNNKNQAKLTIELEQYLILQQQSTINTLESFGIENANELVTKGEFKLLQTQIENKQRKKALIEIFTKHKAEEAHKEEQKKAISSLNYLMKIKSKTDAVIKKNLDSKELTRDTIIDRYASKYQKATSYVNQVATKTANEVEKYKHIFGKNLNTDEQDKLADTIMKRE
jgi:hypothetical protein